MSAHRSQTGYRMIRVARGVVGGLSLLLGAVPIAGGRATAQIPAVTPAPFVDSMCVGATALVDERRRGAGNVATAQSMVKIRLTPVAAAQQPRGLEADYDFPLIRSIGVRALGTTSQFIADAIIPAQGEPMRVGGQRRVWIGCKGQEFDIEVLSVTAGGSAPFRRAQRSNERGVCWTNEAARSGSIEGRSGVKRDGTYRRLRDELIALAEEQPLWVQAIDYGRSVKGCPLTMIRLARDVARRSTERRPAVVITGALHGNEDLGIEMRLAQRFVRDPDTLKGLASYLSAGGVIYVVPVVNPDGFDAQARINAASEVIGRNDPISLELDPDRRDPRELGNLNRDFAVLPLSQSRFTQRESSELASYIDDDLRLNSLQLAFALDYHCCANVAIIPWSYRNSGPQEKDLGEFGWAAQKLREHFGETFQVATFHRLFPGSGNAPGSSTDYYYARYNTIALAFEGARGGEAPRLQQHLMFLDAVFLRLAERYRVP